MDFLALLQSAVVIAMETRGFALARSTTGYFLIAPPEQNKKIVDASAVCNLIYFQR